jgi:diacylglycerol kinase family enzyme
MNRHIVFLVNPISGTRNKTGIEEAIRLKTAVQGIAFRIFPTVASGDYSFLKDYLIENAVTDVVIAGGDGTVNSVVKELHSFDLAFGIIPC